jgi:hypothetical protein
MGAPKVGARARDRFVQRDRHCTACMHGFDALDDLCCPCLFGVVTVRRGVQALDEAERELRALRFRERQHDLEQRGFTHGRCRVHWGGLAVQRRAVRTTPAELDRTPLLLTATSQAGHLEDEHRTVWDVLLDAARRSRTEFADVGPQRRATRPPSRARAAVISIAEPGGIRFRSAARWIRRAQTPSRAVRVPRGSFEDARVAAGLRGIGSRVQAGNASGATPSRPVARGRLSQLYSATSWPCSAGASALLGAIVTRARPFSAAPINASNARPAAISLRRTSARDRTR